MLALPLQRIVAVDSKPIFRAFINKNFGQGSDEKFEEDCRGFQSARDAAIAVTQSSEETGLNNLLFIIFQLKKMAPRLAEYETEMQISFTYFDAFKQTKKITCRTLYYDLSVFLWNYAALHSHVGSRVDRSTDEGIKIAQRHYQQSAGALDSIKEDCLRHMKENENANFGPINSQVLMMCKELMLAQAQLCFYEKAVKDKKAGTMKPGIIAKLAAQTSMFYRSAADMSKQGLCASYVDENWGIHSEFQCRCFESAAEYWMSQSMKDSALSKGSGYALEIARLNRAEIKIQQAMAFATKEKLGISLTNGAAALLRTITSAKASAIHDNRTVYMEAIPLDGTLSPVSAVSLVKPSEPPEYKGTCSVQFSIVANCII
jgi:programmed cell death 6-interacting protein